MEHIRHSGDENDGVLDFKPIGEGLGFLKHDKGSRLGGMNFPRSRKEGRSKVLSTKDSGEFGHRIEAPILGKERPSPGLDKMKVQEKFRTPPLLLRSLAYLLDVTIITLLMLGTLSLFSLILSGSLNFRPFLMGVEQAEVVFCLTALYCLYYLVYFTLTEARGTVGKGILSMETLHISGERPSLYRCFLRSLITLLSALVLFFPLFLGLQDKASETKLNQK